MRAQLKWIIAFALLLGVGEAHALLSPQSPFELHGDEKPVEVAAGGKFEFKISIGMPEGHYLYADETDVDFTSLDGLVISQIHYPKPVPYVDPYMGKRVDVYRGDVTITITGGAPEHLKAGEHDLVAILSFRGCSPTLCFRPEEREIAFQVDIAQGAQEEKAPAIAAESPEQGKAAEKGAPEMGGLRGMLKVRDFATLLDRGLGLAILIVFIAGLLTSLTPCVWPVIPVVLLFVGVHPHKRFLENFLLAASLTLGLVLVYAVLGIFAVAAGKNLGFLFQQPFFLAIVVIFFFAMSLSMFGVFDLKMPGRLQQRLHSLGGEGYRGAFFAGMGTGLVASPCSGPVLAALLGYVALQRNYAMGFALLVVYGVGMSLIIVIIGACYGELAGKLRGGPWMIWIRRVLGLILLFPAAFYMGSLFRWSSARVGMADKPRIEWIVSEPDALRFAQDSKRAVMLEFGAEWCPPCRALDSGLFERPDIVALSYRLVPLRVDATVETKEVRRLIEKYRVVGWPTVIFIDPHGKQYGDLRVNSYDTGAIEKGMKEAVGRSESVGR